MQGGRGKGRREGQDVRDGGKASPHALVRRDCTDVERGVDPQGLPGGAAG